MKSNNNSNVQWLMCELDLNLDFDNDVREEVWKTLVQQIIKGNVIPVIGNEMVKVDKVSSFHYLLNVMANRVYNVQGNVSSFTSLMVFPLDSLMFSISAYSHMIFNSLLLKDR